jgi:hypothetical protein
LELKPFFEKGFLLGKWAGSVYPRIPVKKFRQVSADRKVADTCADSDSQKVLKVPRKGTKLQQKPL